MNNEVKGGNGGAIANIKSAVFNIANAIFSDNEAFVNGGAIYNADEMTLANAEFSGNKAANGGAIYNDTAGTMTIDGATFENNATGTDGKGGAIYNAGTMTFEGKVTLAAGTETASNDIYNTGTLNLNGTTELNSAVTNDETLKVNGSTTLNRKASPPAAPAQAMHPMSATIANAAIIPYLAWKCVSFCPKPGCHPPSAPSARPVHTGSGSR